MFNRRLKAQVALLEAELVHALAVQDEIASQRDRYRREVTLWRDEARIMQSDGAHVKAKVCGARMQARVSMRLSDPAEECPF